MTRVVAMSTLLFAACFNPTFDNPTCGPNGECPSGTTCVQSVCRAIGDEIDAPAGTDAADAAIDAPEDSASDGPPIDSPPGCGDGVIMGTETCDDRNTLACGTCTADCGNVVPPRAATGSIMCALGNTQLDGETFTISDGINLPVVFEWDRNGSFSPPRVPVMYDVSFGQGQMADAVTMAINSAPTLLITAVHSGGPVATLTHDRQTALGNQPITHTVSNAQFVANGMSGGAAGDCPSNVGCTQNVDCASGTCLAATETCQ